MLTISDIKTALERGGLELVKVKNTAANLGKTPERVFAEEVGKTQSFVDHRTGVEWFPPTAWAWWAACRTIHWLRSQLRENGIEPRRIPNDAPQHPEPEYLTPRAGIQIQGERAEG